MKRIFYVILAIIAISAVVSCKSDGDKNTSSDNWDKYKEWRKANVAWFDRQADSLDSDGNRYYKSLYPEWNPAAEILIHYYNDRKETEGRLSPLFTSTCDIIYKGSLFTDVPFDSSYNQTQYGLGIARLRADKVVTGMSIALMDMRVGDSCRIVIPYPLGYGGVAVSSVILPYSSLVFDLALKDIPYYEINK
ncbi:MAG: FKBP-type peptidyl-prolyl cis-trans isomerase [Muribaculaceae bacterium]|nr:FKBP-type peptidyl-prolyl cis-trans isomerase [Muribaculaceae bacterium]